MIQNRIQLAEYFAELGFTKGAEIGVADGRYSEILLEKNPSLYLISVDPFYRPGHREKTEERLKKYEKRVEIWDETSMDVVGTVKDESLDFVFIDGDHRFDFVMEDIIGWTRKVKKNGIVSGHDYYHFHNSGVVEAVNAFTQIHRIELNIIPRSTGGHRDDQVPCWYFVKR
jgi:hypothetical protein